MLRSFEVEVFCAPHIPVVLPVHAYTLLHVVLYVHALQHISSCVHFLLHLEQEP